MPPSTPPTTLTSRLRVRGRRHLTPSTIACAAPLLMVAILGWQQRWVADDGWINIRVVEQFFAGNGPVFNAGERVEVTTSTLWLWFLLAGRALLPGVLPEVTGAYLGLLLTLLGMLFASLGAARLARRTGPQPARQKVFVHAPLGMLVMAALPPFWDFATSGLETGLAFFWLGSGFWLLARRTGGEKLPGVLGQWPVVPAVWFGLGPLVRPDFAVYAGLFVIALFCTDLRGWWRTLAACFAGLVVPGIYQVWRMGYFASLVPNTALAKDAGADQLHRGLLYLLDYAGLYSLLAPLLACLVGVYALVRRGLGARDLSLLAVTLAPVLGGLVHAAYIVRVGGDFMHARFLLPDTFALVLPAAVIGVDRIRRETALTLIAFTLGWAVAISSGTRPPYGEDMASDRGIASERAFWERGSVTKRMLSRYDWSSIAQAEAGRLARWDHESGYSYYVDKGERYQTATGTGVYLAHHNMGILSVWAGVDVNIIDMLALADPIAARAKIDPRIKDPHERTGHVEKPEAWRLARYAAPEADEPRAVVNARIAMQCGDLAVVQDAVTGELTPEKFWHNVGLAPRLTTFTFPADPFEARKQLCGWQPQPKLP